MTIQDANLKWAYRPDRMTLPVDFIVLHHAAAESASVEDVHRYHVSLGWAGIGYHYYIRRDGSIWRGRRPEEMGAHCMHVNSRSWGICFEGNFNTQSITTPQVVNGIQLVRQLKYLRPEAHVVPHREIASTDCPGKLFPVSAFKNLEVISMDSPSDWAKDACSWAVAAGLIRGDEHGDKHWHDPPTREELAVILKRFSDFIKGGES